MTFFVCRQVDGTGDYHVEQDELAQKSQSCAFTYMQNMYLKINKVT
jgi:hypothetical protein